MADLDIAIALVYSSMLWCRHQAKLKSNFRITLLPCVPNYKYKPFKPVWSEKMFMEKHLSDTIFIKELKMSNLGSNRGQKKLFKGTVKEKWKGV